MRRIPIYQIILPLMTLMACSQGYNREASTAAEVTPLQSEARKKIKSADLRCRVPNVLNATAALEHMVVALDGVVEESTLENEVQEQHTLQLSGDSVRLVKRYTPVADLTLRIPSQYLDSVVTRLTAMAAFIDYRRLQDQDVTLDYERNAMKNEALAQRHQSENKRQPVTPHHDSAAFAAIDRSIDNLNILEHAAFSTITVRLFQPELADVQVIANPEQQTRLNLGTASVNALHNGATIFRELFLFLLQIWPLWILAIAGRLWYLKYYRKPAPLPKT